MHGLTMMRAAVGEPFAKPFANAKQVQNAIWQALRSLGWRVYREVPVRDRGDGRRGRVDLVALRGGEVIAIEVDGQNPRQKSVHKLRQVPRATFRLVLLRNAKPPYRVAGEPHVWCAGLEALT